MKKRFLTLTFCFFALSSFAQENEMGKRLANIDWNEDSTEITTIKDIAKVQQSIARQTALKDHNAKIWAHRGFFNLAWHRKNSLTPHSEIKTGVPSYNDGWVPDFNNDKYGGALQLGRVIKLHKPIANMVMFGLDYTGMDLNVNYYKAENKGKNIYDNSQQFTTEDNESYYYSHWNAAKLDVSYGMSFGPSITLAPFTHINGAWGLHYLKFSFYYHIGYEAAFQLQLASYEGDVKMPTGDSKPKNNELNQLKEHNSTQFMLGHGMYQAWGINMVWKRVGIGYEHRWASKIKYMNLTKDAKDEYGKDKYEFDATTNRIYFTYKIGK